MPVTALSLAALWLGTFANVFLMGFQSRNVNAARYTAAAFTSFGITVAQLVFVRAAATEAPMLFLMVTGTAGPVGICASIFVSQRLFPKKVAHDAH
jgi:hypothetical protein